MVDFKKIREKLLCHDFDAYYTNERRGGIAYVDLNVTCTDVKREI